SLVCICPVESVTSIEKCRWGAASGLLALSCAPIHALHSGLSGSVVSHHPIKALASGRIQCSAIASPARPFCRFDRSHESILSRLVARAGRPEVSLGGVP